MTQEEFAKKVVGCGAPMWNLTLSGERNLKYKTALKVCEKINTPVEIWLDCGRKKSVLAQLRRRAWNKFCKEQRA